MRRVAICGLLVIAPLLAAVLGLTACGSSDQPAEQQSAASPAATSAARFAAGQSVAAKWTDGSLYLATVTAVDGDNVTVTYTDDGTSRTVPATDVRAIPDTGFAVGDRVRAVWAGGRFYQFPWRLRHPRRVKMGAWKGYLPLRVRSARWTARRTR